MPLDAHQNSGIDLQNLRTTTAYEYRAVFGSSYVLPKPKPKPKPKPMPMPKPVKEHRVAPFVFPVSIILSVTAPAPAHDIWVRRHLMPWTGITPAATLHEVWLSSQGEVAADFPVFCHYVNVGRLVQPDSMTTHVYLLCA